MKRYGLLLLAFLAIFILFRESVGEGCPDLPFCESCTSRGKCDKCAEPYGLNADGKGCEDCFVVSKGSCSKCKSLTRCDECFHRKQGYVSPTTTAMCDDCSANCRSCATNGAGKCDEGWCDVGYELEDDQTCAKEQPDWF
jgi:hypothetical protein